MRALDRHAFTFVRYDLDARIEPEQHRLGIRGKITVRNDSDVPQKNVCLQISSTLHWLTIQFEGKPVKFVSQPYTSDIDHTGGLTEAIVALSRAVAPKQRVELDVGYEGVVPQDATRLTRIGVPTDTAKHSDWDQIGKNFTAVRGIGYVIWYPIATEAVSLWEGNSVFEEGGSWKQREASAQFEVDLCVVGKSSQPVPTVLMNEPIHTERHGGGYDGESCAAHSYDPLGAIVPSFVIGNYSNLNKSNVEIYYFPEHKAGADDYALAVDQIAPFVSKWFGDHRGTSATKSEVIDLADPDAAPFESGTTLLTSLTGDETSMLLSAVRQMAHLYFPSSREWIGDGLASYAQAAYLQEEKGHDAALVYLQNHRNGLILTEKHSLQSGSNSTDHSLINAQDAFYVQAKAMNVWWMLRDIVGDSTFTTTLHNYKPSHDRNERDMQKLVEVQAHRDLEWFFDDWVYNDFGLPDLRITSVYSREVENGSFLTTVTIDNLGAAGAEVPVTAHMANGESVERIVVAGKSKASVRIVTPASPQEITVNDGSVPERETTTHIYKVGSGH